MAGVIFWDVDTQVDFIHADGLLAVEGAASIVPALQRLTRYAHQHGIRIVASADDHDIGHAEITHATLADWQATFPPHCMRGTPGQRKIAATRLDDVLVFEPIPVTAEAVAERVGTHTGDILLHKPALDVFRWNPAAEAVLATLAPHRVVLYGVATDFCVKAAVAGVQRVCPTAELVVVRDAIAAIDAGRGQALCTDWARSGVTLTDTATITA